MEAQNDSLMMPLSGPKNGALEAMKAGVDKSIWPMRIGMEKAAHKVRKASDRFGHTLDFSSEEGQRLPIQSLQNINAREQFGAVFGSTKMVVEARLLRNCKKIDRSINCTAKNDVQNR